MWRKIYFYGKYISQKIKEKGKGNMAEAVVCLLCKNEIKPCQSNIYLIIASSSQIG
jgi:hypothetical protein